MSNNSSSSPLKLVWQAVLLVALVAIAWVLGQALPKSEKLLSVVNPPDQPQSNTPIAPVPAANITFYKLPRSGDPAPLADINNRIATAQKEVIVVARQIAATSILTNLKTRASAGVQVLTLLSPDTMTEFARGKLYQWMRDNQLQGVYRDVLTSASHLMVIDEKTVIISDLPFSQRSYEANEQSGGAVVGFLYIIEDAKLGQSLAEVLRARALLQNKIL